MKKIILLIILSLLITGCTSDEIIKQIDNDNSDLPIAFIYSTENQTLVNTVETFIIFENELEDDRNWHTSDNLSQVIVDYDGDYLIKANISFKPHPSPHTMDVEYQVRLYVNSTVVDYHIHIYDGSGYPDYVDIGGVYRISKNSIVSLSVLCNDNTEPYFDGSTLSNYFIPFLEVKRMW